MMVRSQIVDCIIGTEASVSRLDAVDECGSGDDVPSLVSRTNSTDNRKISSLFPFLQGSSSNSMATLGQHHKTSLREQPFQLYTPSSQLPSIACRQVLQKKHKDNFHYYKNLPRLKMSSRKRVSLSEEPSKKRRIDHHDGSPVNNSRGVQIQTEINHKSIRSGERNEQISLQNGPARERTWRGTIEFDWDGLKLSEDMSAHPSAKISRKAYNFSKNLNSKLHFKLLPLVECYPKIFQDAGPNRDDIALYFYPSRVDRPKGIYSKLLRHMETSNLMMQSRIDGVELLLFSSTILPADSQRIDNNFFIWGVFCRGNN